MVETELAFLEVQVERLAMDAAELREAHLGETPEVLDAVDVRLPAGELVLPVVHAVVFPVAEVDQAVIPSPAVRVDDAP